MSNFTNSPLATLIRIHPTKKNGSGNFKRNITKITIHHAAGIIGGANLLAWGHNPQCGGSWNYGVGNDSVIGLMIDEKDRAWTSSSPANDYQAVTIEVGNSTAAPEWRVSDTAMTALINLCVDICRRNTGIKQKNGQPGIYFDGTPNASLTHHGMFTSTVCPGPFLKGQFQRICDEVNKQLGAVTPTPPKPQPPTAEITVGTVVDFKTGSKNYYPGSSVIPAWVKNDFYHVVTQTTAAGKPVIKGGEPCVLLGRRINKKTGKEEAGINTWVSIKELNAVSSDDVDKTREISEGDIVAVRNGTELYYPGGKKIPSWVILDFYHKVTQTELSGKPVIKGGVPCVLLGRKIEKTRGTESAGINSWIRKDALIIIRKR